MYSTAADQLASLLLDLKNVNAGSSIFITESENLIVIQTGFNSLYVGRVYLFSNAKAKILDTKRKNEGQMEAEVERYIPGLKLFFTRE